MAGDGSTTQQPSEEMRVEFLGKIKGISNAEALVELLKMVDGTSHQPATTHYSATRTDLRPGPDLHGIEPCSKADLWEIAKLRVI